MKNLSRDPALYKKQPEFEARLYEVIIGKIRSIYVSFLEAKHHDYAKLFKNKSQIPDTLVSLLSMLHNEVFVDRAQLPILITNYCKHLGESIAKTLASTQRITTNHSHLVLEGENCNKLI